MTSVWRNLNWRVRREICRNLGEQSWRHKHSKAYWEEVAKKRTSVAKALNHFDDFYANVFEKNWPSIRVALLSQPKYVAVANNFGETNEIVSFLENLGAVDLRKVFEFERDRRAGEPGENRRKWSADETMKKIQEEKLDDEIRSIYPPTEDITCTRSSTLDDGSSRLIDPSNNPNSGVLHEFVPATVLKGREDYVLETDHYRYYNTDPAPVHIENQNLLDFPPQLNIFSFPSGFSDKFPGKTRFSKKLKVTDYYMMDGASIFPVLALDLQPGDNVLDMCSAPGGKGLLCLQTHRINHITLNDVSISRSNRTRRVIKEFLYDSHEQFSSGKITITSEDGREIKEENLFNKILVDVPCTIDRHSATVNDNNIFKTERIKERLKLPELQSDLLTNALKLVKKGGIVVYSTCSLSPIQNDGVVHMALSKISEETNIKIAVIDMSTALEPTTTMFKFEFNSSRYGHLVVPYLPSNFGPMYFCKLLRID